MIRASSSSAARSLRPTDRRMGGFTLIELMVVLGIVVLLLAAAVPAFNYITGSRSADAAENVISAMLVRARSRAIETQRPAGVAFFINPRDGRATLAIVAQKASASASDEDPYPLYRGWSVSSLKNLTTPASPTDYKQGHEVIALQTDSTMVLHRYVVDQFAASVDHTATGDSTADPASTNAPPNNPPWQKLDSSTLFLDTSATDYESGEFETLPAGLGVQLLNDAKGLSLNPPAGTNFDRYVQTGVILFDSQGRLTSQSFAFLRGSTMFKLLVKQSDWGLYSQIPPAPPTASPVYSQLGLVIYNRSAFLADPDHSEGDYCMPGVNLTAPAAGKESTEELWFDANTTPLFVNRYNGTLLRGQ